MTKLHSLSELPWYTELALIINCTVLGPISKQFVFLLQMFDECVAKDKYLALGHFQLAVAQTLCGDRQSAITSFMVRTVA